jgi:hypothetical protein
MKRFIITGLVLSALMGSQGSYAQSRQSFDDDIYYNSKSQPKTTKAKTTSTTAKQTTEPAPTYTSSDYSQSYNTNDNSSEYQNSTAFETNTGTYYQTYESGDGYQDGTDDYSYATQISHFYYPWYGQPYWSTCYAPYWYNPWYAPGFSFGIGFGFGYGGYSSMYFGFGYPYYPYYPFYPSYGYPYYGYGYGGCGYYGGYYPGGGYCGNGYGYGAHPITYGPRYSTNTVRNDYAHGYRPTPSRDVSLNGQKAPVPVVPVNSNFNSIGSNGVRYDHNAGQQVDVATTPTQPTVRTEANSAPVPAFNDSRNSPTYQSNQPTYNNNVSNGYDRPGASQSTPNPGYNNGDRNEAANVQQAQAQPQQQHRERGGGFFGFGSRNNDVSVRSMEAPRTQPSYSQPSYSQPRMNQGSAPRMSTPSSGGFGGGHSSFGGGSRGGGSFGGGGGGGMRGGGGRR